MAARVRWTQRKKQAFLKALRGRGSVYAAARVVGLSPSGAYLVRKTDEGFREAWDAAIEEALDLLEAELHRRAVKGTAKPVFYRGQKCGSYRTYSDRLGMFLLKRRRPHLFGEGEGEGGAALPDKSPREILRQRLDDMAEETDGEGTGTP